MTRTAPRNSPSGPDSGVELMTTTRPGCWPLHSTRNSVSGFRVARVSPSAAKQPREHPPAPTRCLAGADRASSTKQMSSRERLAWMTRIWVSTTTTASGMARKMASRLRRRPSFSASSSRISRSRRSRSVTSWTMGM